MTDSGPGRGWNDCSSGPQSSKQLHFISLPMLLSVFLPECKFYSGPTNQRPLMTNERPGHWVAVSQHCSAMHFAWSIEISAPVPRSGQVSGQANKTILLSNNGLRKWMQNNNCSNDLFERFEWNLLNPISDFTHSLFWLINLPHNNAGTLVARCPIMTRWIVHDKGSIFLKYIMWQLMGK